MTPESSAAGPRFPLLVVTGVAHSGTTLLGSLLNGHPAVHCVGEMARISIAVERNLKCSCGAATAECEFWQAVLPILKGPRDYDWRDLTPDMYEQVRRHAGRPVLADLSKTLPWRMERRLGSPWKRANVGYIWLVRDSRGSMASHFRKGGDVAAVLPRHRKWIGRIAKFMEAKGDRGITLSYEDLCKNPQREMERICAWMGVPFDEAMMSPAEHEHHLTHANVFNYMGRVNEIRHDERWRTELPQEVQAAIEDSMRRVPFLRDQYLSSNAESSKARP